MANSRQQQLSTKAQRRAAQRSEEMRKQQAVARRRTRLLVAGGVILVIVVVVGVLVAVGLNSSSSKSPSSTAASTDVISSVTGVPQSTFDKIGAGDIKARPSTISSTPLTQNGKPRVLYAGAEYCPYCAAERWAMVAALSRFGTFKDLGQTQSSGTDVYPNTATLSFHGASYTSKYLAFTGLELQDTNGKTLDTPSPADGKLISKYDAQQYTGAQSGGIPFVLMGGKFVISGASYDPAVLKGLSHQQIAQQLSDPSSDVAKAVLGTANVITSDLCQLTKNQPAKVCSSPGVVAAK